MLLGKVSMDSKSEFTQSLYELVQKQKISLIESLEIISRFNRDGKVEKAARYILGCLEKGVSFSSALKTCDEIEFDNVYVTFITFAEKTGCLGETCEFLYKRCKRKNENFVQIVEACTYPVFVVFVAFMAVIFLLVWGKNRNSIFVFSGATYGTVMQSCMLACGFLICFFMGAFFVVKNILSDNKMFESFLAADFLVSSGINFVDAMDALISVAGYDSVLGHQFQKVKSKVIEGIDLISAFDGIGEKLERFLYIACKTGGECEVFGKMAAFIEEKDKKKRKFCFLLIEPIFICGTGIFLIILLSGVFFPMLHSLGL